MYIINRIIQATPPLLRNVWAVSQLGNKAYTQNLTFQNLEPSP